MGVREGDAAGEEKEKKKRSYAERVSGKVDKRGLRVLRSGR